RDVVRSRRAQTVVIIFTSKKGGTPCRRVRSVTEAGNEGVPVARERETAEGVRTAKLAACRTPRAKAPGTAMCAGVVGKSTAILVEAGASSRERGKSAPRLFGRR